MSKPVVPAQCRACLNLDEEDLCRIHDYLPGEFSREDVKDCPSFLEKYKEDDLTKLVEYIDEDKDQLIEAKLTDVVNRILDGYAEKFKITVIGVARRKIKAMVRMVDIIDLLLEKLSDKDSLEDMSSSQSIRLLSELNSSINNDLTFIMKLVNPDTQLKDLQMWIDNRTININGTSPATERKVDEILNLSATSRDKVRDAFEALLYQVASDEYEEINEIVDVSEEEAYIEN